MSGVRDDQLRLCFEVHTIPGHPRHDDGRAGFGPLLPWLNGHESDVFSVGTCTDASKLPPEFTRADRSDGVFFVDSPGRD